MVFNFSKIILKINISFLLNIIINSIEKSYFGLFLIFNCKKKDSMDIVVAFSWNHPANTGKPIVAVLINAPAKIRKGSNGYFSIMGRLSLYVL